MTTTNNTHKPNYLIANNSRKTRCEENNETKKTNRNNCKYFEGDIRLSD